MPSLHPLSYPSSQWSRLGPRPVISTIKKAPLQDSKVQRGLRDSAKGDPGAAELILSCHVILGGVTQALTLRRKVCILALHFGLGVTLDRSSSSPGRAWFLHLYNGEGNNSPLLQCVVSIYEMRHAKWLT